MNTNIAVISIIVEEGVSTAELNQLLSDAAPYIISRMGIPYHQKHINIISIAVDAPQAAIVALSDALSSLPGVSTTTACPDLPVGDLS